MPTPGGTYSQDRQQIVLPAFVSAAKGPRRPGVACGPTGCGRRRPARQTRALVLVYLQVRAKNIWCGPLASRCTVLARQIRETALRAAIVRLTSPCRL